METAIDLETENKCPKCKKELPEFSLESQDDGYVSANGHICWDCKIITTWWGKIVPDTPKTRNGEK